MKEYNRYDSLDFMRGLAIFFMIMQHAMIIHEVSGGEGDTLLGNIFVLLGTAPAAPVFLFILGVFAVHSKKILTDNLIRGLKLFVFGYIFNLLRFTLPALIGDKPYGEGDTPLELFLVVDIFQVPGLSLMVLAIIKETVKSKILLLTMIPAVLFVSPQLWGIYNNSILLSPLTGIGKNVIFPLFPWIIFPIIGMYLSPFLLQKTIPAKPIVQMGLLLGITGFLTLNLFAESNYSRLDFGTGLLIISFILFWIVACDVLVNSLIKSRFSIVARTLFYWSKNVTAIFILQWLIYGWSTLLIGANQQNDRVSVLIGFFVIFITHLLIKYTPVNKVIPVL